MTSEPMKQAGAEDSDGMESSLKELPMEDLPELSPGKRLSVAEASGKVSVMESMEANSSRDDSSVTESFRKESPRRDSLRKSSLLMCSSLPSVADSSTENPDSRLIESAETRVHAVSAAACALSMANEAVRIEQEALFMLEKSRSLKKQALDMLKHSDNSVKVRVMDRSSHGPDHCVAISNDHAGPDSKTVEPSLGQRRVDVGPAGPALAQRWADDTLLSGGRGDINKNGELKPCGVAGGVEICPPSSNSPCVVEDDLPDDCCSAEGSIKVEPDSMASDDGQNITTEQQTLTCDVCSKTFARKCNLTQHMSTHNGTFQCKSCTLSFKSRHLLSKHELSHRNGNLKSTGTRLHSLRIKNQQRQKQRESEGMIKSHREPKARGYDRGSGKKRTKKTDSGSRSSSRTSGTRSSPRASKKTDSDSFPEEGMEEVSGGKTYFSEKASDNHPVLNSVTVKETSKKNPSSQKSSKINKCSISEIKLRRCITCNESFSSQSALVAHARQAHQSDRPFGCHECKKAFRQSNHLREHLMTHTGERPFKCPTCGMEFRQRGAFNCHLKRHQGIVNTFPCTQCQRTFPRKGTLQKHEALHQLKANLGTLGGGVDDAYERSSDDLKNNELLRFAKPHVCSKCNKRFTTQHNLSRHLQTHQDRVRHFKCKICPKAFFDKHQLARHVEGHTGIKKYVCDICNEKLSAAASLAYHMRSQHTNLRPYSCPHCPKRFVGKSGLRAHVAVHTGHKPNECPICHKRFIQSARLKSHMRIHTNERPFQCERCASRYTDPNILKHHIHLVHEGGTRHECTVCSKVCKSRGQLNAHMVMHTGKPIYQCEVCARSFTRLGVLRSHAQIHSGVKPFACSTCDKAFLRKKELDDHMTSHSDVRPFYCDICGKSFKRNDTLKVHRRIHLGGKPFHCRLCDRKFNSSWDFKKHCRKHHDATPQGQVFGPRLDTAQTPSADKDAEPQTVVVKNGNAALGPAGTDKPATQPVLAGVTAVPTVHAHNSSASAMPEGQSCEDAALLRSDEDGKVMLVKCEMPEDSLLLGSDTAGCAVVLESVAPEGTVLLYF